MKRSEGRQSTLALWKSMKAEFLGRLTDPELRKCLDECIAFREMMAQAMSYDDGGGIERAFRGGPGAKPRRIHELAHHLTRELTPLFDSLQQYLSIDWFGSIDDGLNTRMELGIWALLVDWVTRTRDGSAIELNFGMLPSGLEIEIGCDSPNLEGVPILTGPAFELANRLMDLSGWIDLKCPLGGRAIQLNVATPMIEVPLRRVA